MTPARLQRLSVFDHGFLYGDGVYDTVRCYGVHPAWWSEHVLRLKASARAIGIKTPFSSITLLRSVQQLLRAEKRTDASVRITLTRGAGPLGLDPTLCKTPNLFLQLHPDRDIDTWRRLGVSAGVVSVRHMPAESLDCRIKSISLLPMVLAKAEAKKRGFFEGLLLNMKGELTEGTTTNLFFVRQGVLHTPAVSCGLLPGITREKVLRFARTCGIATREGRYRPAVLARAQEVFLTNSSLEVMPVGKPGPTARRLQEGYRLAIMAELLHERVSR